MLELFEKWYDTHKDDEGLMFAVGLTPMDVKVVPIKDAKVWFEKRIRQIEKLLKFENHEIRIYRCMGVTPQWIEDAKKGNIHDYGDHWTVSRELAPSLKNGYGGRVEKDNVILEAVVAESEFDVLSLFQPSYSEEWEELEILPRTAHLIKIHNGDFSEVLAEMDQLISTNNDF